MTGYRKQLIIGIDPGTTTAYAILDTSGQPLKTRSSKKLHLDLMIKEITNVGSPLIVGTDRRKCPEMINKFAAKTGAAKTTPEYDISTAEKNSLTKEFLTENSHQKDALAAALIAYKQFEPLLRRVDRTLIKENKTQFADKVMDIVISKKISIKKALATVT